MTGLCTGKVPARKVTACVMELRRKGGKEEQ